MHRQKRSKPACVATDDHTWKRATLPIQIEGVCVRSVTDTALPEFFALVCSVQELADKVCGHAPNIDFEKAQAK